MFKDLDTSQRLSYHLINTNEDGAKGVDVIEPSFTWTERWAFGPIKSLTPEGKKASESYERKMVELTGRVNKDKFRGFPPESVLLMGGVGRNVAPLTWEFDYKFSHKPERKTLDVGPFYIDINIDFYPGWTLVDQSEPEDIERDDGSPAKIPRTVKFHKVYKKGDFSELGLAEKVPFGYGTPSDELYLDDIPVIGEEWKLPVWATLL